jgi:Mitochondrial carrier protein
MCETTAVASTIVGSVAAGLVSTGLGHPLDTIKTHLQTNATFRSSFHVVQTIRFGVFRGVTPPMVNAIIMNTAMFSVFDSVQDTWNNPFAAGLVSGFATAMISTPTDHVKIQAQLASGGKEGRRSVWTILRHPSTGRWITPRQLYRSHTANLAREGIFTMVYLGVYHWVLSPITISRDDVSPKKNEKDLWTVAATSSLTGALAWIVSYPCDTIKTIMQNGNSWEQVCRV